ncbi:universal stress protein [Desulfonema magnum]|uniref:Universal stress protein A family protein n=1 Tax=Desulfonema magnum TaxID=45655 RepID=A0A975BSL2_9BACT|nr:universal stress protein [Desulfonema magnum]QTA90967.1 Universal stress protein A family protein [Desulfonema magnum]
MQEDPKKILAAVDGSAQALDAVRYIGNVFPSHRTEVVLFHLNTEVPDAFLNLKKEPGFRSNVLPVSAWAIQLKMNVHKFIETAIKILLNAGFPSEALKIKVQSKKAGVARDIIRESYQGFDAVVAGRSGVSRLKDVVVGSVANKLISKLPHIPIVAVAGNPLPGKFLIGFDTSEGSMKAVDCLGSLMGNSDYEVMLCNVIRPLSIHPEIKKTFNPEHEIKWIEENKKNIEPALAEAANCLIKAGFSPECVGKEIVTNKVSRALTIVKKAEEEGYGSVVVGRWRLTVLEEFIIGRVSRKVLHMADKIAVWIV